MKGLMHITNYEQYACKLIFNAANCAVAVIQPLNMQCQIAFTVLMITKICIRQKFMKNQNVKFLKFLINTSEPSSIDSESDHEK